MAVKRRRGRTEPGWDCLFVCLFKGKRDFEPTYDEKNKPVEEESVDRGERSDS